ncbi:MAG: PKD domain-containing protein [Gammaproteobacteria bacterium]|nr:PKD domain-containing protein [Gammaproteobacteria bacterium]
MMKNIHISRLLSVCTLGRLFPQAGKFSACLIFVSLLLGSLPAMAVNIDPANKYAWSESAGWLNFGDPLHGVDVHADHLEGYAWAENIGWVKLGTYSGGDAHTYANDAMNTYGVNQDGAGKLSGYGWSEAAGWIRFDDPSGGVTIDNSGVFDGYAWSENLGWIHFQNAAPSYSVHAISDKTLAASFTVTPPTGAAPLDVTLDGTVSFSDSAIDSYEWFVSTGLTFREPNPTFTFYKAGTHNITLTVTDSRGEKSEITKTVTVNAANAPPVADFRLPYSSTAPLEVSLDASPSSDPDGTIAGYAWRVTDPNGTEIFADTAEKSAPFTFNDFGVYTVALTVTDDAGASMTKERKLLVIPGVFTTLDLELSSSTILNEDTINVSGMLNRYPSRGADLSGSLVKLLITAPDKTALPEQTVATDSSGKYLFSDISGFDQKGTYTLQTRFGGSDLLEPSDSPALPLLVGQAAGYVLIVQGKIQDDPQGVLAYNKTVSRIYNKLMERHFEDANIQYLNYDTSQSGVDNSPNLANITAALTDLQTRMNAVPAPLYVVMVNHGGANGTFHLGDETMSAADLAAEMDALEAGLTPEALAKPRILLLGYCYSGTFIPTLSKPGRVIITSAAADEESYKGPLEAPEPGETEGIRSGEFFMEELFQRLGRGESFRTAFENATERTEQYTRQGGASANSANRFRDEAMQHPLLDDDGDKQGSNLLSASQGDGVLSAKFFLGAGQNYDTANDGNAAAEILKVTQTLFLSTGKSTADDLFIEVNDTDTTRVLSAWVDIRPPSTTLYKPEDESTEQLQIEGLPSIPLICDQVSRCTGSSSDFAEPGKYELFYSVRDTLTGEISPIKRSVVYKNSEGNQAPTNFSLLTPASDAMPETSIIFDWRSAQDSESVTYTLEVAAGEAFADDVVYREEELRASTAAINLNTALANGDKGLKDQTRYYWRVTAVDWYGARTFSSVFSFTTNNTNLADWLVSFDVQDGLNYEDLTGVTVTAQTVPADPSIMPQPPENFIFDEWSGYFPVGQQAVTEVEISKPGYQSETRTVDTARGKPAQLNIALYPDASARFSSVNGEGILSLQSVDVDGVFYAVDLRMEAYPQGNFGVGFRIVNESIDIGVDAGADNARFSIAPSGIGQLVVPFIDVENAGFYSLGMHLVPGTEPVLFAADTATELGQ